MQKMNEKPLGMLYGNSFLRYLSNIPNIDY